MLVVFCKTCEGSRLFVTIPFLQLTLPLDCEEVKKCQATWGQKSCVSAARSILTLAVTSFAGLTFSGPSGPLYLSDECMHTRTVFKYLAWSCVHVFHGALFD